MITHNQTGRSSVGSSKDGLKRIKAHIEALRRGNHPVEDMQDDFIHYGEDYTLSIVGSYSTYADRNMEFDWMLKLKSNIRSCGYNYKDRKWCGKGNGGNLYG